MGNPLGKNNSGFSKLESLRKQNPDFDTNSAPTPRPNSKIPCIHQRDVEALIAFSNFPIACFQFNPSIDLKSPTCKIVDAVWANSSECIEANPTLAQDLNRDRDELIGLEFGDLFPPTAENFEMIKAWVLNKFMLQGWQTPLTLPSGKEAVRKYSIVPVFSVNKVARLWISYTDVTEQTKAFEMLGNAEKHYRTLVERPGLILVRTRRDGTYEYLTPHVFDTVGYTADDFKNDPKLLGKTLHPDDRDAHEPIYEARRTKSKEIVEAEYRVKHTDGTYHWFYERQIPKLDENGEVEFFDSIALDITKRKQLEIDVIHAKRMETFGALAGGIAHDFNNHLAVITGQIGLCLNELDKESPLYERLSAAERAALVAAEISKSLLSLGHKGEAHFEILSIERMIDESSLLLKHSFPPSIAIEINLEPELHYIRGEAAQLQQVLMNLAVNAKDAIKGEGLISITARNIRIKSAPKPEDYPNTPTGEYVEVIVEDNGSGIPSEVLKQIYDPFFTTKERGEGTGLGLSMVYSIIRDHGGRIHTSSTEGAGTTIKFIIPATSDSPTSSKHRSLKEVKGGTETILVADDDDMVLSMVTTALELQGYTVLCAENGEEVLSKVEQAEPDLILLDFTMPKLSGREVLERLKKSKVSSPVILTSGYGCNSPEVSVNPDEIADFISKPYQLQDLLLRVRHVLDLNFKK